MTWNKKQVFFRKIKKTQFCFLQKNFFFLVVAPTKGEYIDIFSNIRMTILLSYYRNQSERTSSVESFHLVGIKILLFWLEGKYSDFIPFSCFSNILVVSCRSAFIGRRVIINFKFYLHLYVRL